MNNNNPKNSQSRPVGRQPRPVNPQPRPMGAQPSGPQPRPVNPQPRPMGAQPSGPQPRPVNPQPRPMGAQPSGPQPRPVNPQPRPMGAQPSGPQPRPAGPQPRPVNPRPRPMGVQPSGPQPRPAGRQPRPVNPQPRTMGAQSSGPQPRPVNPQPRPMGLNIDEKDRIASFHEEYYKTIEGKRIVAVDIINIEDWDRYSIKLEEILNLFYGYNPLKEYSYENISATLSSIRNDSKAVPGLPARVSKFLGLDEDNNILIFKPYKSPEQPDFSYEQKQQILTNRERIVEVKKKFLGKKLFISNQGKTYIKDTSVSNSNYEVQKNVLLYVLGSEGISDWIRGDEYSDIRDSINKLIRNFSFGDNYPILFDNQIALLPENGEFIKLKEYK